MRRIRLHYQDKDNQLYYIINKDDKHILGLTSYAQIYKKETITKIFKEYFNDYRLTFKSQLELKNALNNFLTVYNLNLQFRIESSKYYTEKYLINKHYHRKNKWATVYNPNYLEKYSFKSNNENSLFIYGKYKAYKILLKEYKVLEINPSKVKNKLGIINDCELLLNSDHLVALKTNYINTKQISIVGYGDTYKESINNLEKLVLEHNIIL